MFKKLPDATQKETKTVDIVTEQSEHLCTDDCFEPREKIKPRGLKKIPLGYVYQDNKGRFFQEFGEGEWLEVTGLLFSIASGGACLIFEPKEQLHIHSRGGKTVARTTSQRNSEADYDYYSSEAAKKLKKKGLNLRNSLEKIASKVKEEIPKAPKKRKPVKGTGHGAAGVPRTPLTEEVVRLIGAGKSKTQVLNEMLQWAVNNSISVAGPHKNNIKKLVDYWWTKKKSTYK